MEEGTDLEQLASRRNTCEFCGKVTQLLLDQIGLTIKVVLREHLRTALQCVTAADGTSGPGALWGSTRDTLGCTAASQQFPFFFVNQLLAVLFYISPVPVSARLMAARTLSSVKDCFLISLTPHLCDSRVRKILAVFIENSHS